MMRRMRSWARCLSPLVVVTLLVPTLVGYAAVPIPDEALRARRRVVADALVHVARFLTFLAARLRLYAGDIPLPFGAADPEPFEPEY